MNKNNLQSFYSLIRAGLWEQSVRLSPISPIDFVALYQLAEEQSVVGLIAAGLEHVEDMTLTKQQVMPFMKNVITIEHRNVSMNLFIGKLFRDLQSADVKALLVKGQGIAQCYERPLWRSAGDVDLLFDAENYEKAKAVLTPLAHFYEKEDTARKHFAMEIESWPVELHGTLHSNLSNRINAQIDSIQAESSGNNDVRVWHNGGTDVYLPGPDSDAIYIFVHILQHFFRGGIGLRQICDWCRLLWIYRDSIDRDLLESRIHQLKLMTEWKAFGAFADVYLGMPIKAIPFYDDSPRWKRKAHRISRYVLEVGNFGRNRDIGYIKQYPYLIRKTISFGRSISDLIRHLAISPITSLLVFGRKVQIGTQVVLQGE